MYYVEGFPTTSHGEYQVSGLGTRGSVGLLLPIFFPMFLVRALGRFFVSSSSGGGTFFGARPLQRGGAWLFSLYSLLTGYVVVFPTASFGGVVYVRVYRDLDYSLASVLQRASNYYCSNVVQAVRYRRFSSVVLLVVSNV